MCVEIRPNLDDLRCSNTRILQAVAAANKPAVSASGDATLDVAIEVVQKLPVVQL